MLARLNECDVAVIMASAQFTPKVKDENGKTQRTGQQHFLMGSHNGPRWVAIPTATRRTLLLQTQLAFGDWRKDISTSIAMDYARAPYVANMIHQVDHLLDHQTLGVMASEHVELAADWLHTKADIIHDDDLNTGDATGSDWMLAICRELGADTYICGRPSMNYLNTEAFAREGIEVKVQDWTAPRYDQIWSRPLFNLSYLDLVAHMPRTEARALLSST